MPRIDGTYKVQPFYDLSDSQEQDKIGLVTWIWQYVATFTYTNWDRWGNRENSWSESATMDELCQGRLMDMTARMCAVRKDGTYRDYMEAMARYSDTGKVSELQAVWSKPSGSSANVDSEAWSDYEYVNVPDSEFHDGQFFSALPGTYGLHITNLAGKSQDQLGVKAR